MSTSEGQRRLDGLERKYVRQDWGGLEMYWWKTLDILGEGRWQWSCQERGNGEGLKGGLWMRWERIMTAVDVTEEDADERADEESAVATPNGSSRKKNYYYSYLEDRWQMVAYTLQISSVS